MIALAKKSGLFHALPTALFIINGAEGSLSYMTPAAGRLLGVVSLLDAETQLGELLTEIYHMNETQEGQGLLSQDIPYFMDYVQLTRGDDTIYCDATVGYTTALHNEIFCILESYDEAKLVGGERMLFNVAQSLSSDMLFRYDVRNSTMRYFGATQNLFKLPELLTNYPQCIVAAGLIYEADLEIFLKFADNVKNGIVEPCEIRIYDKDKRLNWYKKEYKIIYDNKGRALEAVGKFTNIQEQKDLESLIRIDALAGCLRKDAFEMMTKDYMAENPNSQDVLFVIDLDNFKAVNDNLGHQFGDMVIKGVGTKLMQLFHDCDFVGRIGGDEFMVFMKDIADVSVAEKKAKEILSALDATYTGASSSYRITASVGMAYHPLDGMTFQELYEHGDMALYEAKHNGKNGAVIYHSSLSKGTMENTLPFDVAARSMAQHFDIEVVSSIFNLLFETNDYDISLQAALEYLGTRFDVSRSYIFEMHPTVPEVYKNTYEWCNTGVRAEKDTLDQVPLELFQEFFSQANDQGILYCNDLSVLEKEEGRAILEAQGIESVLHCYITSGDRISYVVGFDECRNPRVWSPLEVSTLLNATKIIVQFLSYKKTLQAVDTISRERLSVLNSLHYQAYIIDVNTHEITFFNDHTKSTVDGIALGKQCYEIFRGNHQQCKNCPLCKMEESGESHARVVIYNEHLKKNTLVLATKLSSYDGRESMFVTSVDLGAVDGMPADIRI